MPRGDRTGPGGMGSRTGRGMGFCSGYDRPGYMNSGAGFGYGQGAGRGFGGRHYGAGYGAFSGRGYGRNFGPAYGPYYAAPPAGYPKEAEKGYIEDEISFLKDQLKTLEGRLAEKQDDE